MHSFWWDFQKICSPLNFIFINIKIVPWTGWWSSMLFFLVTFMSLSVTEWLSSMRGGTFCVLFILFLYYDCFTHIYKIISLEWSRLVMIGLEAINWKNIRGKEIICVLNDILGFCSAQLFHRFFIWGWEYFICNMIFFN